MFEGGNSATNGAKDGDFFSEQKLSKDTSDVKENLKVCKVLSMSGGGAKGAYEAGALHTLVNTLEGPESHYDVISGVSVGSITAAGAALFGPDETKEMGDFIFNLWHNLTNDQVWRFWNSSNPVAGLTTKGGFLDNQPLVNLIQRILNEHDCQLKKTVLVSANDAITGNYVDIRLNDRNDTDFVASAVVGSASVPFVFSPMNMSRFGLDYLMVDAGFTWNLNMESGIDECYKIDGITHPSQIIVDIINLSPDELPPFIGEDED